ncbi:Uncharacterised protein [Kocuria rosea]|nr:Uncharacterised protein [Kocuria rosea]
MTTSTTPDGSARLDIAPRVTDGFGSGRRDACVRRRSALLMTHPAREYDVVIAGGGLAGRSLAFFLSREPGLSGARILIIDDAGDRYPHRSLIYWHDGALPLPLTPAATFTNLAVDAGPAQRVLPLERHRLCLTSSRDVFRCLDDVIDANPQISRLDARVSRVRAHADSVDVALSDSRLVTASHCFDSTLPPRHQGTTAHVGCGLRTPPSTRRSPPSSSSGPANTTPCTSTASCRSQSGKPSSKSPGSCRGGLPPRNSRSSRQRRTTCAKSGV